MGRHPVVDLAICIGAGWLAGGAAQWLRQPLIVGYLVAGFVIGPQVLDLLGNAANVQAIAEIGLVLLLFLVGLELDLKRLRSLGRAVTVTGVTQVVGGSLLGVGLFWLLGYRLGGGRLDALYLGFIAAQSSTVIAMKLMQEKHELGTLAGEITVGVLVMQDLAAILFVGLQPTFLDPRLPLVAATLAKIIFLGAVALAASRYVLPWVFRVIAVRPELVTLGSLAWCLVMAAGADGLGLSRELGALLAGMAISTFPYALDIEARVASLRDFFLILFFVVLGFGIPLPKLALLGTVLLMALVVVVTRFATVFVPVYATGGGSRAGFIASVNLAQVSELGLMLVVLGEPLGHVGPELAGPILYSFIVLGLISSYAITYSDQLHRLAWPALRRFGLHEGPEKERQPADGDATDIYLLGFYHVASSLVAELERADPSVLHRLTVVDFNPVVLQNLRGRGVRALYGDLGRRDSLERAGVAQAKLILCSLTNSVLRGTSAVNLIKHVRALNPQARIVAVAETLDEERSLRGAGADYVVLPRLLSAHDFLAAIRAFDSQLLEQKAAEALTAIKDRQEILN